MGKHTTLKTSCQFAMDSLRWVFPSTCNALRDAWARFPIQPLVQEEPKVVYCGGRSHPVVPASHAIWQEEPVQRGFQMSTQHMEVEQLCLSRLSREVVLPEPKVACVIFLPEEGVNGVSGRPTGENNTIIHIHAQCSVWCFPGPCDEEECVEGGEDQGDRGALRCPHRLITLRGHGPVK